MKRTKLLVAAAALCSMLAVSAEAATVRWLHIEQNPDVAAFYADVAKRFEAANPGTTVEMQYLENESYKKKLTTLLQSPDRPNIIYSWAGGVLREQVKAGVIEDITAPVNSGWRERFNPAALSVYTLDGKIYGVPMLISQVGFFYNKDLFAKAGVDAQRDQDMGRSAGSGEEAEGGRHHADRRRRRRQVADPFLLDATWPCATAASRRSTPRCAARARASPQRHSSRPASMFRQLADLEAVPARLPRRDLSAVVGPVRRRQGGDGCCRATSCSTACGERGRQERHPGRQARLVPVPDACLAARARLRHARRPQRLAGDQGLAEGGRRVPEVLLDAQSSARGGRARLLHPGGERRHQNACQTAAAAPHRREPRAARSTTRSSTTRCSGLRWAPWSTTFRPTSPPGG